MRKLLFFLVCVILYFNYAGCKEQTEQNLNKNVHSQRKRFSFPGMPSGGPGGGMGGPGGGMGGPGSGMGRPGGGMGGMGAGGPFHGGGGPSSGGPMGMSGMGSGPSPGGMNPGGNTLFNPSHCLQKEIICPQWCIMQDEFGCRSCPCGPGGGMLAGSMGSFMSHMPYIGSHSFSHVSQSSSSQDCLAVKLCESQCAGAYSLGNTGADGCPTCTCNTHTSTTSSGGSMPSFGGMGGGGGFGGGGFGGPFSMGGGTGGGSSGGSSSSSSSSSTATSSGSSGNSVTNNYYYITTGSGSQSTGSSGISTMTGFHVQPTTYTIECHMEEVCTQTCGGNYELGEYTSDGCPSCVCPPKQQVVYTQPAVTSVATAYQVQCPEMSCAYGCKVGYKCGADGCPTCECALPSGYNAHEVVVQHQLVCSTSFACTSRCDVGYQCGNDGCPTCDCLVGTIKPQTEIACNDCEWIDFLEPEPQMVSYVRPRPQPQPQTVYVEKTDTCHDCEETRPQVVYVQPEPKPQPVYVTNTHECHDCEQPKPQIIYERPRPRPQPQTVYVTGTTQTECHDCETHHQTVYVEKPRPQSVIVQKPRPQAHTYVVTQPQKETGGTSSGIIMGALTAGHVSGGGGGGGGMPVGLHGGSMSTGGGMAGYSGGGSGGSAYCPPMRHDCHPSCIRYDTPHCRRCECYSSPMQG